jgi:uroporphyrinogen decarboxylase
MERIRRTPDFEQFLRVLQRKERPKHLPFYEHLASSGFIARRTETRFDEWEMGEGPYWDVYVDFWMGMGFDCVPIEIPPNLPLNKNEDMIGEASHGSEATVTIRNWRDYETYPWPSLDAPLDFQHFEEVAKRLPEGVKMVAGVCAGPYEWITYLMGVQGLAITLCTDPDLVAAVFEKIGETHTAALRRIAAMDEVGALRQGDDLGFKTSTFLAPEQLRAHVFPVYKALVDIAHNAGKPFVLHSCGNLARVYDDIIDDCGIDGKHSFEDVILPVADFKAQYGHKVTAVGGLDVDTICRADEDVLRAYTRRQIEACFDDGWWALGTGNSLPDYMPVENYMIVLDEAIKITG